MPAFYELQLIILVVACAIWLLIDNQLSKARSPREKFSGGTAQAVWRLTRQYLVVYAIVMGEYCIAYCPPATVTQSRVT